MIPFVESHVSKSASFTSSFGQHVLFLQLQVGQQLQQDYIDTALISKSNNIENIKMY